MVQKLYIVFMGILIALFVGVGIAAVYPGPIAPSYPPSIATPFEKSTPDPYPNPNEQKYQEEQASYQRKVSVYNRNVSIIAMATALLLLIISLLVLKNIALFTDGVLLGGILTLIYSIARGFGNGDNLYRFLLVGVGLVVGMTVGYLKFARPVTPEHK